MLHMLTLTDRSVLSPDKSSPGQNVLRQKYVARVRALKRGVQMCNKAASTKLDKGGRFNSKTEVSQIHLSVWRS